MNKKHFLLPLVCLIFCVWFTTCDDDTEVVTDLWEQIRNTAWTKDGDTSVKIGFYSPNKGPARDDEDLHRYADPDNPTPYVIVVIDGFFSYDSGYRLRSGHRFFILIDRTGNQILYGPVDKPYFQHRMFDISLSGNSMTISEFSNPELVYIDIYEWGVDYTEYSLCDFFNGTYTKTSSDPDYDWSNWGWYK
jgi:hypothetical protein